MIENAVEHNADTSFVRFRYETLYIVIRTERFVYPQIIGRIVFMLRRRTVDGIEIQTGYAELRKVIELVDNALQITAVSLFIRYRFVGRRPFAIRICIGFAAPAKARRKDFVPHRICLLYTLRAHETGRKVVCRLLLENKNQRIEEPSP